MYITVYICYITDNTACIWDINNGTVLLKYIGHTGSGEYIIYVIGIIILYLLNSEFNIVSSK